MCPQQPHSPPQIAYAYFLMVTEWLKIVVSLCYCSIHASLQVFLESTLG